MPQWPKNICTKEVLTGNTVYMYYIKSLGKSSLTLEYFFQLFFGNFNLHACRSWVFNSTSILKIQVWKEKVQIVKNILCKELYYYLDSVTCDFTTYPSSTLEIHHRMKRTFQHRKIVMAIAQWKQNLSASQYQQPICQTILIEEMAWHHIYQPKRLKRYHIIRYSYFVSA